MSIVIEDLYESKRARTFIWDFGDGEKLTTTNPTISHTFKNEGSFVVKLRYLKNKNDKIDKAKDGGSVKVVVKPKPNILPVPQLACSSNVVNSLECDSTGSIDSDGAIVSYKFDWGDGERTGNRRNRLFAAEEVIILLSRDFGSDIDLAMEQAFKTLSKK